jgi:hypothetical protein
VKHSGFVDLFALRIFSQVEAMKKHWSMSVVVLVCGLAGGCSRPDPTYQGKTASSWVHELVDMKERTPEQNQEIAIAIKALGKDAVAALVQSLDDRADHSTVFVLIMLAQIGPDAKAAVPRLRKMAGDGGPRAHTARDVIEVIEGRKAHLGDV